MYKNQALKDRLNQLYTESELSIDKFAATLKISGSAMQNYLNPNNTQNSRDLPTDKIADVCRGYNVSADWLLGLSDVRKPSTDLRGVCEYTGLSENAILKIEKLSKEDEYNSDCISQMIESEKFSHVITRLYAYIASMDCLEDSDFDDDMRSFDIVDDKVLLHRTEAVRYFKEALKESIGILCNDLYIQHIQQHVFSNAPAKFRLVSADELVYIREQDTKQE